MFDRQPSWLGRRPLPWTVAVPALVAATWLGTWWAVHHGVISPQFTFEQGYAPPLAGFAVAALAVSAGAGPPHALTLGSGVTLGLVLGTVVPGAATGISTLGILVVSVGGATAGGLGYGLAAGVARWRRSTR